MIARLRAAWSNHPAMTSLFLATVAIMVFFAVRSITGFIYWSDPKLRDQPIEAWMTPRYVVQSWKLPNDVMIKALGEGPMPGKRRTLADIAQSQGISLQQLSDRITAAAAEHRANKK